MRASRWLLTALAAMLPTVAHASCEASFVDGSNIVNITPTQSFDNQRLVERFTISVRNTGDQPCTLRIGIGQTLDTTANRFPAYSLTGPGGMEVVTGLTDVSNSTGFGSEFLVAADSLISVPYEVRLAVGWGSEAGLYSQDLVFQLLDAQSGESLATQRMQLNLDIPRVALIRFAGASGADGPPRIEMGPILTNGPTRSPPFALRILSTAAYRIDLVSANSGALRRAGGTDLIPYELTLGGQSMDLAAGADSVRVGRHTTSVGDVHRVGIVINPDPRYHAGEYADHVTVTVTTI